MKKKNAADQFSTICLAAAVVLALIVAFTSCNQQDYAGCKVYYHPEFQHIIDLTQIQDNPDPAEDTLYIFEYRNERGETFRHAHTSMEAPEFIAVDTTSY